MKLAYTPVFNSIDLPAPIAREAKAPAGPLNQMFFEFISFRPDCAS